MPAADRVCLGVVIGAHGVRGEVRLRAFTAKPEAIGAYGALEDAAGGRRFELRHVRASGKGVVASIVGVADRNAAEALRGTELWVERARLPEPDADEWYRDDLKGLTVVDTNGAPVGHVRAVAVFVAGDVVEIVTTEGSDLVLPFTRAQFPTVDVAQGRLIMAPATFLDAAGSS